MSHIYRTAFHQNSNVGLYGFANNKLAIVSPYVATRTQKKMEEILGVPVISTNICGTALVGIFVAGNDNGLIVPNMIQEHELELLRKHIPVTVIDTKFTALGNIVLCNNKAALISPDLEDKKSEIKKALGVKRIEVRMIEEVETVGALATMTETHCLLSSMAPEEDEEYIANLFEVAVTRGTVNLGSPYVKSGLIVNNNGFVVGKQSGGPETVMIDRALGFLE